MIIQLVHLIALTFLIGILILISVSEARGVFTAYVQSMVLSEGKIRECQGPVAGLSLTIVTTPCNSKKQSIVIIADRTPPRIQVPNHNLIVANATNARGSVVDYKVSATDNVATNIHPICQPIASGQVFPIGNTTIVCTAKDNNNNTAKASFVVVVEDNLRIQLLSQPFITNYTSHERSFVTNIVYDRINYPIYDSTDQRSIVKDIADRVDLDGSLSKIIIATSSAGAIVKYNPTLGGENVSATCIPSSGSMLPIGTHFITCTAIDKQGTMIMQKFVITVAADRTPPRIQVPNHNLIVANATNARGSVVDYKVSATDNVATNIHPICQPIASGQVFPIGNTTIVCTAKDNNNNTAKASFVVVIADRTPPRIQVPNHNLIVANATNARGSVVDYKVSATDNVATNIHPICQPIASGQVFPIGNTTIVCTAKDNNNNTAKASIFGINADKTTPKKKVPKHNPKVAKATNARGSVVDYKVSATDNVATNIHPICQPIASGQVFPIGNTTIVCT